MKYKTFYFFLLIIAIIYSPSVSSQVTSQSDTGSVYSGVILNTDNYPKLSAIPNPKEQVMENEFDTNEPPQILPNITAPKNSYYIEDKNAETKGLGRSAGDPILLNDFAGIPMTNYIPPDPNVAVGPNHVVAMVNSKFTIWDKAGNLLKSINADQWFSSLYPDPIAGDPQIIYDHYNNRWIMVFHRASATAPSFLYTAVSDDDNPLGVWYAWALPGSYNGHVNYNLFADYPHIGYDSLAVYITSRQFQFGGSFQYSRIRIIPKSDLYFSGAGTVHYTDFWNISYPTFSSKADGIQPTVTHGNPSNYYLIQAPSNGANFLALYKISNPLNSPTLTGSNVAVTYYSRPPDANQLGGGTPLISANGAQIQERAYFRNDTLWTVHAVANPNQTSHSAVAYYKINVNTSTVIDEITFGSLGHWYLFPALAVDPGGNVCVTYSRSGDTEYCGAYYAGLKNGDPTGFSGSIALREGMGNYVVTYGGTRNRWGDYMGIHLDPVDQYNFWVFTEFADAPSNTWNTWVGEVRVAPYNGPHLFTRNSSMNLGNVEVGYSGIPQEVKIFNYGSEDVTISNIPASVGPFQTQNVPSGIINLAPYDSLTFTVVFTPSDPGPINETLNLTSNDPGFEGIDLFGNGYVINQVIQGTMYASSGSSSGGEFYSINTVTGEADTIGLSEYDDVDYISKISINPHTNIIYGLYAQNDSSYLLRVNPTLGDAYILNTIHLPDLQAIAFDTSATLYAIKKSGEIYTIDINDGSHTLVAAAGVTLASIAFDPETNDLYGSALVIIGPNKDRIYKMELPSGAPTIIGNTGLGVVTNTIEFDNQGNLYGSVGANNVLSDFIQIDKTTAQGTVLGSTGVHELTGLAFARSGLTGVEDHNTRPGIPSDYSLKQNYPNPFNPSTRIEYSLPVSANVKVTIYNLLGEVVNVLVNSQQNAGSHSVVWNSQGINGNKVGSGVYFYELKANGVNGSDFTQIRKMILLK